MRIVTNEISLEHLIEECRKRLKENFSRYLTHVPDSELRLAMQYCLENGGKYIRPLLVYASGSLFNASWENMDVAATAVEVMHTYSLIHDDLPCMDNADLRRGKMTCHRAFSESTAVLVGDGLQALSVQILADQPAPLSTAKRLEMIKLLSSACGSYGMVAGQSMDMNLLKDATISTDLLLTTYRLKTGVLLSACVQLGRIASNDMDEINERAMTKFGDCIGLAFQIQDDILDLEATTENLGKSQATDEKNNKFTYARLKGLEHAKKEVDRLYEQALASINYLGYKAQLLRELTTYLLKRQK